MHFRAYAKIRKKSAINQETSENLEKKLEKEKDFSKWNEILSLPFEVTTIRFTEKLRIPKISCIHSNKYLYIFASYYITHNYTQELSEKLLTGDLSSVDTLHAFQWKALQLNKKLNCVVHFIHDAEDEAKACDQVPLNGIVEKIRILYFLYYMCPYI